MSEAVAAATTERAPLTAALTRQIVALIQDGNLAAGDRLPSTKALADRFDVATPTLREALRHLEATGVVDIRHGSGIYVRQDRQRLMLANPGAGELDTHLALQVLDARLLIEPHLAELAAPRITDIELAAVAEALDRGAEGLDQPAEAYLAANADFHRAIARASGNVVLAETVETLIELHAHELHVVDPDGAFQHRRERDHPDHVRIHEALAGGDGIAAGALMRAHLALARAGVVARLDAERARDAAR